MAILENKPARIQNNTGQLMLGYSSFLYLFLEKRRETQIGTRRIKRKHFSVSCTKFDIQGWES